MHGSLVMASYLPPSSSLGPGKVPGKSSICGLNLDSQALAGFSFFEYNHCVPGRLWVTSLPRDPSLSQAEGELVVALGLVKSRSSLIFVFSLPLG